MTCRPDYKNCRDYDPIQRPESRCMKDSNVGKCLEEQKAWEKEVDDFFDEYFEMRR